MRFLLDTDVLSQLGRPRPHRAATTWLLQHLEASCVSVITVGEIASGISRLPQAQAERADALRTWLLDIRTDFGARLLPVDADVAVRWGAMTAELAANPPAAADALIAATASVHDLTVATRNVRHFERTGVRLVNPFEAA